MNRVSFADGLLLALAASGSGGLIFLILAPWFALTTLFKLLATVLAAGVVCFWMIRVPKKVGRITAFSLWLVLTILAWIFIPSAVVFTGLHVVMVWLLRSLYFYTSPLAAMVDLGLCGLSIIVSIAAFNHTESVFLALWCLFLLQALVTLIPPNFKQYCGKQCGGSFSNDRFEKAYRTAEWALRKIS